MARMLSKPSTLALAPPVTVSPRKEAFLSQTTLPPPKKGRVWRAWLTLEQMRPAWSALSAVPSMMSLEKSPASGGVSLRTSRRAASLTRASSVPMKAKTLPAGAGEAFLGGGMAGRATVLCRGARAVAGCGRLLELDADAFFGAAGEEVVVGEDGVGPDFAFEDVVALEFGVFFGVGFDDDDFAFVTEGDDFVAGEDDLAGAEAFFFPHVFAGADVDAGEGAFAVFFEAEHAVEVAVFDDGGAPVVEAFVFAAPDGFGAEAAAGFGDFEGAGADAVAGGAVDDVFKDDGAGGGGDFVGEGGAPQDSAFLGVDRDEAGLGEEDGLVDAVDVGEDGGGVGHLVVLPFPGDLAGFFVEGEEGLAFAAAGEEEEAAVDEGGGGVLPFDVHAGVFLEDVVLPDEVAGVGFEAVDAEVGVDAVGVAVVDDGGGAGAVAAFVAFVAGIAAAVVFGDDGEGFAPFFLAGACVEAEEGFAGVAVDFSGDDGVGVFGGDSEGAESGGGIGFPEGFEAGALPVADGGGGFDGAVAVGAAEGSPFEGGGGAGDDEAEGGGEVAGIHIGSIEVSGCDGGTETAGQGIVSERRMTRKSLVVLANDG